MDDPLEKLFVNGRDHHSPSNEKATLSIGLHIGNISVKMREYALAGDDACAVGEVIDSAISEISKVLTRSLDSKTQ
jgi:hypothetical protein